MADGEEKASVDQSLKDAHEIINGPRRLRPDPATERECFECGCILDDDGFCDTCGKSAQLG